IPVKTIRAIVEHLRARGEDPLPGRRRERDETARALYDEGVRVEEIARRLGCGASTVVRALGDRPRPAQSRRQQAIEDADRPPRAGLTAGAIAERLAYSPVTTRNRLALTSSRRYEPSPRVRRARERRALALELHRRGHTHAQIAEILEVARETVTAYLR